MWSWTHRRSPHPLDSQQIRAKTTHTQIVARRGAVKGAACTPRSASRRWPSLISQRGRMSVAELADQFEVTTETVRRDLSTLERIGLVRRVHGGAVPSRLAHRDRVRARRARPGQHRAEGGDRRRRRRPAPRPGSIIVIDAGSTTARLAASSPATTGSPWSPTRSRSPRGWPACPRSSCTCCPAGSAHDPRGGRHRDRRGAGPTSAPTSPSWAPTASPSATASPPPTATRRPPSAR